MKQWILLILLICGSVNASFKFPMLMDAEIDVEISSSSIRYNTKVTWDSVDVSDVYRDAVPATALIVTNIGAYVEHPSSPLSVALRVPPYVSNTTFGLTYYELAELFYAEHPLSGTLSGTASRSYANLYQNAPIRVCMGALITPNSGYTPSDLFTPGNLSDCIQVPPADVRCEFLEADLTYDFGRIITHKAAGTSLVKDINVACNNTGFKFGIAMLPYSDQIQLSNGMTADFTVNGSKLSSYRQVMDNTTFTIPVQATLSGEPTESGAFNGQGILRINYY